MALNLVTFQDKEKLNTDPNVANINKIIDSDMNQLKDVANTNANNIGDLSQLNTTDKSSIIGSINETINYVSLNNKASYSYTQMVASGPSITSQAFMDIEYDDTFKFCRISGFINVSAGAPSGTITIPGTPLRPSSEKTINSIMVIGFNGGIWFGKTDIKTNGDVVFNMQNLGQQSVNIVVVPCFIYLG